MSAGETEAVADLLYPMGLRIDGQISLVEPESNWSAIWYSGIPIFSWQLANHTDQLHNSKFLTSSRYPLLAVLLELGSEQSRKMCQLHRIRYGSEWMH